MRKAKILNDDYTAIIPFDRLRKYDVFMLYEDDGSVVTDEDGHDTWRAMNDPYLNEDGIYEIECVPYVYNSNGDE